MMLLLASHSSNRLKFVANPLASIAPGHEGARLDDAVLLLLLKRSTGIDVHVPAPYKPDTGKPAVTTPGEGSLPRLQHETVKHWPAGTGPQPPFRTFRASVQSTSAGVRAIVLVHTHCRLRWGEEVLVLVTSSAVSDCGWVGNWQDGSAYRSTCTDHHEHPIQAGEVPARGSYGSFQKWNRTYLGRGLKKKGCAHWAQITFPVNIVIFLSKDLYFLCNL